MNVLIAVLLFMTVFYTSKIYCKATVEQYSVKRSDMMNSGYEQCKSSNEVCSVNNDCCSNCCTSFTYSSMTCQDECPEKVNADTSADTHGNVVWKGKQPVSEEDLTVPGQDGSKVKEPGKISSRQQRENKNITPDVKNVQSVVSRVRTKDSTKDELGDKVIDFKPSLDIGEIIVKKVETKPNKDIGIRIIDDSRDNSNETETKTHENIEIGLSVINITKGGKDDEDAGENQNTDIGTPIVKIREKAKGKTNIDRSVDSTRIKFGSQRRYNIGDEAETKTVDTSRENKDLGGDVITIKKTKTEKTAKPDQNFNNLKIINTNISQKIVTRKDIVNNPITAVNSSKNATIRKDLAVLQDKRVTNSSEAINTHTTPKSNTATSVTTSCPDARCEDSSQSFADDIKKILTQKLPNLMALSPGKEKTSTSKKPVCKSTGSTCEHPAQCCSQCCAVSDGVFQCFDKGTDECQSSLPGAIAPKCKKAGDHCETHSECCGNKCTDCGRSSKCDNEHGNICRLKFKQQSTKLCKNLGDTCKEASECCSQCCAVSDGAFKCFEEGTHECQPGDNVSNATMAEFVEI
uniref:Uncharacterized protein n=1 Tax=Cacopsylla melanoneura TaxID=428564 RepID=A0A8D8LBB3_9HEMI